VHNTKKSKEKPAASPKAADFKEKKAPRKAVANAVKLVLKDAVSSEVDEESDFEPSAEEDEESEIELMDEHSVMKPQFLRNDGSR